MFRLNLKGWTTVGSANTGSISLRSPWFVNFELPEDDPNFLVPEVSSATLVLNQFHIVVHLDRRGVASQKFDLLGRNSQRNAEAHLERMAGVKTKGSKFKSVRKRVVEEGVDEGVVDREEEVKGVVVGHGNLGEVRDIVSGYQQIQLPVASTTASCLHIPVWPKAKLKNVLLSLIHHYNDGPPVRANAHVPPMGSRFTERAGEEWPVPDLRSQC